MASQYGTPRVEINQLVGGGNITNRSLDDIFCVLGETQFGEFDTPTLISNTTEYKDKFGAFTTPFSLMCKWALERGVKLRISRVAKRESNGSITGFNAYFDITASGATTARIEAKSIGTYGNSITVQKINGLTWDTRIIKVTVPNVGVQNLNYKASGQTAADLAKLNAESKWVTFTELYAATFDAFNTTITLAGGTNMATPLTADYTGVQSNQTGVYAFDKVSEVKWIACDRAVNAIDVALNEYAVKRNAIHLLRTPTGITGTAAVDYRNATGGYSGTKIESGRTWGVFGGLLTNVNETPTTITSLADVFVAISNKNKFGKRHQSYSVWEYSKINGTLGVDYNLSVESRVTESNGVFYNGLNAVVEENGEIRHLGDNTFDTIPKSPFAYCGNVEVLQDLIYKFRPIYRTYIHKTNNPDNWRLMYNDIKAILDAYKADGAIEDYNYQGDQDAVMESEYQVNQIQDVRDGKYKAIVNIKFFTTMRYIQLDLTGTLSSVNIEVTTV